MLFSTVALALLPLTFALPTKETHLVSDLKRQEPSLSNQILEHITQLNASTANLNTAVNKFDGSFLGLIPQGIAVVLAERKLENAIDDTTETAQQSAQFTNNESLAILTALTSTLAPIQGSLQSVESKYTAFKSKFLAGIVLSDLKTLKEKTGGLLTALQTKFDPNTAPFLDLGKDVLNEAFDSAIGVYSQ